MATMSRGMRNRAIASTKMNAVRLALGCAPTDSSLPHTCCTVCCAMFRIHHDPTRHFLSPSSSKTFAPKRGAAASFRWYVVRRKRYVAHSADRLLCTGGFSWFRDGQQNGGQRAHLDRSQNDQQVVVRARQCHQSFDRKCPPHSLSRLQTYAATSRFVGSMSFTRVHDKRLCYTADRC